MFLILGPVGFRKEEKFMLSVLIWNWCCTNEYIWHRRCHKLAWFSHCQRAKINILHLFLCCPFASPTPPYFFGLMKVHLLLLLVEICHWFQVNVFPVFSCPPSGKNVLLSELTGHLIHVPLWEPVTNGWSCPCCVSHLQNKFLQDGSLTESHRKLHPLSNGLKKMYVKSTLPSSIARLPP